MKDQKKIFMQRAVELSRRSMESGGGPFGAVIVRDGKIIAEGGNGVTTRCDPTAHAEVTAIRSAAIALDTFDLSGCEIYTSCEPCPMCLGAIYWARLDRMYFANDRQDAAEAGFDDSFIYEEIVLDPDDRTIKGEQIESPEAEQVFSDWKKKEDKIDY